MGDLRKRTTWQAALAELVGTFFLALAALLAPTPSTALAVSLTLAAFVYALGDISGCNVNPAVTLALVVTRRRPGPRRRPRRPRPLAAHPPVQTPTVRRTLHSLYTALSAIAAGHAALLALHPHGTPPTPV